MSFPLRRSSPILALIIIYQFEIDLPFCTLTKLYILYGNDTKNKIYDQLTNQQQQQNGVNHLIKLEHLTSSIN